LTVFFLKKIMFYAVARGHNVGIYSTWDECKAEVAGYKGARYKKFPSRQAAEQFIQENQNAQRERLDHSPERRQGGNRNRNNHEEEEERAEVYQIFEAYPARNRDRNEDRMRDQQWRAREQEKQRERERDQSVMTRQITRPQPSLRNLTNNNHDETVIVYTDGSCLANGAPHAAAGIGVFWGFGDPRNKAERLPGTLQTNQRAELTAAIRALEMAVGIQKPLEIRTDSNYTIQCVTSWIQIWQRNNWKTVNGKSVKNDDLIRRLHALNSTRLCPVKWTHVKGHSTDVGNQMADQLANEGARKPVIPNF